MIDNLTSLAARDDLLAVARSWPELRARLAAGGGSALTGMPSGDGDPLPINVAVSDLMRLVEDRTRFYARALLDDDPTWTPRSTMPALLVDVAHRYGHFTASNDRIGLDFVDDAHELVRMVDGLLTPREPAAYLGPCPVDDLDGAGCPGDLYLRPDRDRGWCSQCGAEFTRESQARYLAASMASRLMTRSELLSALVVLDTPVPESTLRTWITRGRLLEHDGGLFLLADAHELAKARRPRAA